MPKRTNPPTLADVATAAGVSTATVSRCLNAPERVSRKTRRRVEATIDRLGYLPNFSARALAARRTDTVGVIIPTMENAIFARGIQAFQEALQSHGCTLLIASSSYRQDLEEEQIRTLGARGIDALLLIGHDRPAHIYRYLAQRHLPVLVSWAYDPASEHLCVGFDNRKAMAALATQVIAAGHRSIGCISAAVADNDRARHRVEGIQEAMGKAGLDPASLRVLETVYALDAGEQAFRQLMQVSSTPTAIMCGNDVLAVGALRAARDMGLHVPRDVSITGFDDIELARLAPIPLTTVHVPHRRMGQYAAQTLLAMLEGQPTQSLELPTTLCMRETLGPVQSLC